MSIVIVTNLCPTFHDSMDYSLSGSSIHGIFQVRILEWVAISSSRSSQPRDGIQVSCITGRFFTTEPPGNPYTSENMCTYMCAHVWLSSCVYTCGCRCVSVCVCLLVRLGACEHARMGLWVPAMQGEC